jgi:hypothetical protein
MTARLHPKLVAVAVGLWALVACGAVLAYTSHASEAGPAAAAPATWPAGVPLSRDPARPTLLVLVHPACPCSRATLRELARVLAKVPGPVSTYVVFMRPLRTGTDPRGSSLWGEATSIPGVVTSVDEDGEIARAFGAVTSGQTLLYGPGADGALQFAGGITQPGGHEGDNAGRDALEALLSSSAHGKARSSVFGCPLFF